MERVFEELSFHAPDRSGHGHRRRRFRRTNLGALARSADISRYVL
jgi:ATP-dependent HslUV protease ATP-binding subunit HslU